MDTKNCYKYDENTKEFLDAVIAFKDPLSGEFNLPKNCTFIEPPEVTEVEVAVFENEGWVVKEDYRRHFVHGDFIGGRPYYDPSKYWWSLPHYMEDIGPIPQGMSFNKYEKPEIANEVIRLENKIKKNKEYLESTDYVHNVILEEPEKAEKYAEVIEERKTKRSEIDPMESDIERLKEQIILLYGEEALNHLY